MGSREWFCAAAVMLSTLSSSVGEASTGVRLPQPSPIALGYTHTMLLKPTGRLFTWGNNSWGQLGVSGVTTAWHPTEVGLSNMASIAAGDGFSLVVMTNGQLWGFGKNEAGQLGRGATNVVANPTPVQVGSSQWRTVAAGKRHALGIKWDGSLWGWGANGSGQLGLGDTANRSAPAVIDSSRSWIAVSAGEDFSVALRADGRVFTAGANGFGQLGRTGSTSSFLAVDDNKCWRVISAGGSHVLAVLDNGTLWSWGRNNTGQLGTGNTTNQTTPGQRGTTIWRTVSAGYRHSMGIATTGARYTWGDDTDRGLGVTTAGSYNSPVLGTDHTNSQYVASGKAFGAKIAANGELKMWGRGNEGQLGMGSSTTVQATPGWPYQFPIDGFAFFNKLGVLAPGSRATAAIRSDGRLETWGSNVSRQLGTSTIGAGGGVLVPTVYVAGNTWMDVAAGETQVVAIRGDGSLWGWGLNVLGESYGRQGAGTDTPTRVGQDFDWIKVTAHYATTFALKADGRLFAFGDNSVGQIGDGVITNPRYVPVEVIRPSGVGNRWVAMAVSNKNGYGITSGGQLFGWGANFQGQLGIGSADTNLAVYTPGVISADLRNWISIGAGAGFAIGLTARGDLFGWGSNTTKQLCRAAPPETYSSPFEIAAGTDFSAITVSHDSMLAVGPGNAVKGCGFNNKGALGTFDFIARPTGTGTTPADTMFYNPRHMVMGDGHTLIIDGYGRRLAAGNGEDGRLGNNRTDNFNWPVEISPGY